MLYVVKETNTKNGPESLWKTCSRMLGGGVKAGSQVEAHRWIQLNVAFSILSDVTEEYNNFGKWIDLLQTGFYGLSILCEFVDKI